MVASHAAGAPDRTLARLRVDARGVSSAAIATRRAALAPPRRGSAGVRARGGARSPPPSRRRWRASPTRASGATDRELLQEELRCGAGGASSSRRVLGVDYGRTRTGLAVSSDGLAPRPLGVVPSQPPADLLRVVVEAARRERAGEIVVGLPVPPAASTRSGRGPGASDLEPGARTPAVVDVAATLIGAAEAAEAAEAARRTLRDGDAAALATAFDAATLSAALKHAGLKAGGFPAERAARLKQLVDANGDLDALPSGLFPGGDEGKRRRVAEVRAENRARLCSSSDGDDLEEEGIIFAEDEGDDGGDESHAGGVRLDRTNLMASSAAAARGSAAARRRAWRSADGDGVDGSKRRGPKPVRMHALCRRFAENLADVAVKDHIPVFMYDESMTSAEAEARAEATKGAKETKGSRRRARVDDVAAAVLLERYFALNHGPAIEIKPKRR